MSYKDKAKQRRAERDQSNKTYFTPAQGENLIRLLPSFDQYQAWEKAGKDKAKRLQALADHAPFMELQKHGEVGPNNRQVRCAMKGSCKGFLCKLVSKLSASGRTAKANKLRPQDQFVVNLAVWDSGANKWTGPFTWEQRLGPTQKGMGRQFFGMIVGAKAYLEDPIRGRAISFTRDGTGLETDYGPLVKDDDATKVPREILEAIKPFAETCGLDDDDSMRAKYEGKEDDRRGRRGRDTDDDDDDDDLDEAEEADDEDEDEDEADDEDEDDDEEEEEAPKKKSKKAAKKKSKKAPPVEDEDEDEDEDEADDEDEDEDEADDEDEDEDEDEADDEDEDEEEDEPPPTKKSKKTAKKKSKPAPADDEDDEDEDDEEIGLDELGLGDSKSKKIKKAAPVKKKKKRA